MTYVRLIPFVFSAVITAALAVWIWNVRADSLTSESTPLIPELTASVLPKAPAVSVPAEFEDGVLPEEVSRLDSLDSLTCAALVKGLPSNHPSLRYVLQRWMELDTEGCVRWIFDLPPGQARQETVSGVLDWWAHTDPEAAQRWFISRTGYRPREVLNGQDELLQKWGDLARCLAETDYRKPGEIVARVRAFSAAELKPTNHVTPHSRLLREWEASVETGPNGGEGLELLQTITDTPGDPLKDWAENQKPALLRALLPRAPQTAMKWLEKHPHSAWGYELLDSGAGTLLRGPGTDTEYPSNVIPVRTEPWPAQEDVISWFLSIPRPGDTKTPMEALTSLWAGLDVNAAGAWLNKQPPESVPDGARAAMADAAAGSDTLAAMTWAGSISADGLREKCLDTVMQQWRSFDPGEAAAFAASQTERKAD